MSEIILYTKPTCPFCKRALALFDAKGAAYKNIIASEDPNVRAEMVKLSGRNTFPQIFINGQHIGGCDDLLALDSQNKLDALLAA